MMTTRNVFLYYILGFFALLAGLLFYLSSPAAQSSYVQGLFSIHEPPLLNLPKLLGPFKGTFPDFIHPLAFSLIGIGLVAHTRRGTNLGVYYFWRSQPCFRVSAVFRRRRPRAASKLVSGYTHIGKRLELFPKWNVFRV